MKVIKTVLNFILTFLLSIMILVCFGVFGIANAKVLNKSYVKKMFDENGFYDAVLEEVNSGFENFIYQSGLPENTIENLATLDMIKTDIDGILDYIMDGKEITLSQEKIREELDLRINNYLTEENRTLSKEERENIVKFEDLMIASYEESINPAKSILDKVNEYYGKFVEIFNKVRVAVLGVTIILFVLLFIVNLKNKFILVDLFGIGFLVTGVILRLLENVILSGFDIDNLVLFSTSMTSIVITTLKDIIFGIGSFGNIFIVLGICFILFFSIIYGAQKNDKN